MAAKPVPADKMAATIAAYEAAGRNAEAAARVLGVASSTLKSRLRVAGVLGGQRREGAMLRGVALFPTMDAVEVTDQYDAEGNLQAFSIRQRPETADALGTPDQPLPNFAYKRISTLYGRENEKVLEWQIQAPERAKLAENIREFVAGLAEPSRGTSPLVAAPEHTDDDLLVIYPMGDPHFGLYAWAEEAGENFDLAEAERVTCAAIDRLVALAPNASEATLLNLGDFFHSDSGADETTKGTPVDVDGRSQKVVRAGVRAMRWCVMRLLEKHQHVRVRNVAGNHDGNAHFALAVALDMHFENNPRVTVDMSPAPHTFQRFGKVLIGECHGDKAKPAALPGVMMCDAREHISETRFWHWHCGHVHHDSLKEFQNVTVETHRTLAAKDAWHAGQGYRSGRTMKAITYHREFGEVHRSTCDITMLRVPA